MKQIIAALIVTIASLQATASGAVSYNCIGKNQLNRESVVFTLAFSDHVREIGYTNQAITIEKISWEKLENPITLQMFSANHNNECKKNELGEFYMTGEDFSMDPTERGDIAAYKVKFDFNCNKDPKLKVKAYCFFE